MPDGGHFSGHCKDFTFTVNTMRKHERFWNKSSSINFYVLNEHPSSVLRMDCRGPEEKQRGLLGRYCKKFHEKNKSAKKE